MCFLSPTHSQIDSCYCWLLVIVVVIVDIVCDIIVAIIYINVNIYISMSISITVMDDNVIVHAQATRLGERMSGTWMSRSPVLSSTHYFPIQRFGQFVLNSFFFGIIQGWLVEYPEQRNLFHMIWWTFMSKLFRFSKKCKSARSETKIRWNSNK